MSRSVIALSSRKFCAVARRAAPLACALAFAGLAPAAHADKIANPTAVFDGLDKITGRIISFEVALNETVQFGTLQITPRVCYSRPPTDQPQTDVFAQVDEIDEKKAVKRIFSGWMFADSPGRNDGHPRRAPGRGLGARHGRPRRRSDRRQRAAIVPDAGARGPEETQAQGPDGRRRPGLGPGARRQQRAAPTRRRVELGQRARPVILRDAMLRIAPQDEALPH
jgi:hypothetical protein